MWHPPVVHAPMWQLFFSLPQSIEQESPQVGMVQFAPWQGIEQPPVLEQSMVQVALAAQSVLQPPAGQLVVHACEPESQVKSQAPSPDAFGMQSQLAPLHEQRAPGRVGSSVQVGGLVAESGGPPSRP